MPASVDRAGAPLPAPSPSSPGGGGGGGGGGEGAGAGGEEGEGALDAREWWGAAGPAARRDRMARASREDGRARAARTRRRAGADRRRPTSASRRQVGTSPRGAPTRPSGGKPRAATAPGPPSPREAAARRAARRGEAWRVGWGGPAGPAWPARAQAARLRGKGARARHRARQRRAAAATPQASQGGVRARTVAEARAVAAAPRHFAAARARMWPGRPGCCGGGGEGVAVPAADDLRAAAADGRGGRARPLVGVVAAAARPPRSPARWDDGDGTMEDEAVCAWASSPGRSAGERARARALVDAATASRPLCLRRPGDPSSVSASHGCVVPGVGGREGNLEAAAAGAQGTRRRMPSCRAGENNRAVPRRASGPRATGHGSRAARAVLEAISEVLLGRGAGGGGVGPGA